MKLNSIDEKLVGAIELSDEDLAGVVGGDRGHGREEKHGKEERHRKEERHGKEERHRKRYH